MRPQTLLFSTAVVVLEKSLVILSAITITFDNRVLHACTLLMCAKNLNK